MTEVVESREKEERQTHDFVLDLLEELRSSNYHPSGWLRFLGRAWRQSRTTAQEHPDLVRSWRHITVALAMALAVSLGLEARAIEGRAALRALPGTALWLAASQFDAYVHLSMNQRASGLPLYDELGTPSTLTLARRATSGLLWGHLIGGRPASKNIIAVALLMAGATDVTDGAIARRTNRTTRLGGYLDGVADFEFWVALALSLWVRRLVPRWLLMLLLLRWLTPLTGSIASYFGLANRVQIGSTLVGKASGVVQAITIGEALLFNRVGRHTKALRPTLHTVTALLLLAAPALQLLKMWQSWAANK